MFSGACLKLIPLLILAYWDFCVQNCIASINPAVWSGLNLWNMNSYHVFCPPRGIKSKWNQIVSWLPFQRHGVTFTFATRWFLKHVLKAAEPLLQIFLPLMKWLSTTCSAEEYCRERIAVQQECWSHFLANVEFPWTLTTELLNWLTKLKCINASGCVFSACFYSFVREGQHLALYWSPYWDVCSLSVSVVFSPAGWQVMSRCLSCHWTLYRRRTWAGPTTSSATGSNWKRSSAGCADETRAWRRLWERLSPWAP